MADLVEFNIRVENNRSVKMPIYEIGSLNPVDWVTRGNTPQRVVTILFSDCNNTLIEKMDQFFLYENYSALSLDELFDKLPQNVVETILFNLDTFKKL